MAIIGDNSGGINPLRLPKSLPPGVPQEFQNTPADLVTLNGSGFAAPVVSGTAALMMQANPNLTAGEVKDLLLEASGDGGVLNAGKAVELAAAERCSIPSCVDGANIAGVQPTKAAKRKINKEELGLEGLGSNSPFRGLNWRGPAEEPPTTLTPMGFGFKTFD